MKKLKLYKLSETISISWVFLGMKASSFKFKVSSSIVKRITVNMMNKLISFKVAPEFFFHNKAVFKDVSMRVLMRMIKNFNRDISVTDNTTTLPISVFASPAPKSNNFILTLLRASGTLYLFKKARLFISSFTTYKTFNSFHGYHDITRRDVCQWVKL